MPGNRAVQLDEVDSKKAYQSVEAQLRARKRALRRRHRRRTLRRLLALVLIVASAIGLYLFDQSPYSRLKVITVSGNQVFTQEEILRMVNLKVNDRTLLSVPYFLELQLKNSKGIADADVKTNLITGNLNVHVSEKRALFYSKNEQGLNVYFQNGAMVTLPFESEGRLNNVPLMTGFDETIRQEIVKAMSSLDDAVIAAISEIRQVNLYADENMIYFYMRDTHIIISSRYDIDVLSSYRQMASQSATNNQCWIVLKMDDGTKNVLASACP